ncbi:MAG TPA: Mov34/MPN/PAD-1 family protein [Candidatus Kapabacteria bacterium]|nr:Mov34/MPN/PAD-1 family protein [Candidatus Kapabacteria bacterium]
MPRRYGIPDSQLKRIAHVEFACDAVARFNDLARLHSHEICGGLFGRAYEERIVVRSIRVVENRTQNVDEFLLLLDDLTNSDAGNRTDGRLVGIIHSHPAGGTTPSVLDVRTMTRSPFIWAITDPLLSEPGLQIRCFKGSGLGAVEVSCEIR